MDISCKSEILFNLHGDDVSLASNQTYCTILSILNKRHQISASLSAISMKNK